MNPLYELIRSLFAEHGDDIDTVKRAAYTAAVTDTQTRDRMVAYAIDTLVQNVWSTKRSERWSTIAAEKRTHLAAPGQRTRPSRDLRHGVRAQIAAAKERFMDMEMEPGKRLRDCTRPDILDYVSRLRKQTATMNFRADWLAAVARLLPDAKQTVSAVLKEADLERLERQQRAAGQARKVVA